MIHSLRTSRGAIEAELARRYLPDFVRSAWPLVEPETDLEWNWHLDELCEVLSSVSSGELRRVIINVPPGTMKSLLVSVFWPAFEWASRPDLRYLCASYGSHLAIRDNRRLRSIVTSDWFRHHYGVELAGDQSAKVRFDTTAGGWRIATSVDGVGTGEHPDRIIIDDPHSADQARSVAERESAKQWFDQTISTRTARDPAIVIIMQRLHAEDLSGHLLARGSWEHVWFPMRFETEEKCSAPEGGLDCECHESAPDRRDRRKEPGELLWPDKWPEQKVRQTELDLGPFGSAGQLQQRPSPEGGGLFRREWFGMVDLAPSSRRVYRGWDTAGTEDGGDWTVGVRMSESDGVIYVEDVIRVQQGPGSVDKLIQSAAGMDGRVCAVREEQEGGSAGKAVVQSRAKSLAGYNYQGVSITGDKVTRARPFRAQCEAGNVRLVRGSWNEEYIRELCSFPVGSHDDQVDASSCAYNSLALERRMDRATW